MTAAAIATCALSGTFYVANLTGESDLEFIRVVLDSIGDVTVEAFVSTEALENGYSLQHKEFPMIVVMSDLPEGIESGDIDSGSFPLLEQLCAGDYLVSVDSEVYCLSSFI